MEMLIGGKWVNKKKLIEVRSPYDGSLVDVVPEGDGEDVERAIESALHGFREIRSLTALNRSEILKKTAELLTASSEDFSRTLTQEVGKTIKEARTEVSRAIQTFTLASEEGKRIHGETVPLDSAPGSEKKMGFFLRVPMGIIATITPFNFPLNLVAHKVAPALAAGNSVILKPATATPLSALKLGKILLKAGLPPQALNIVTGRGEIIGPSLIRDPRVRMVSFTGSLAVGQQIMSWIGLKKATMELGSNSAVVIMEDADLERAAERIKVGGYTLAGQVCISVQRVFLQARIFDQFMERFLPKVKSLKVGNPLEETTDVGPLISEDAAKKVEEWIKEAVSAGAKILCGGKRSGSFLEPTVLIDVSPQSKVYREEAFAPLVVVNRFKTLDEAIKMVNDSQYGLQAGIFTRNIGNAFLAIKEIDVGGIMINEIPTYRADLMPYGGVKGSGLGREGVRFALEEMTELKMVAFELA